jgi:hypothetical protein
LPRNFGIRGPSSSNGEGAGSGSGDCLSKTQLCANSQEDVYGVTPARCRNVKEVGQGFDPKLATEAPVNGGRNYDGPKVAKFLVR